MIEVREVSKKYGETLVVDDVNITLPAKGLVSIIGPNGAGKSTLLSMISRLLPMTTGVVTVDGMDILDTPGEVMAKKLSILRQDNHLSTRIRVRELVEFGRYPYSKGRLAKDDVLHVERALSYFDLEALQDRFLNELSGGQRQRAFIAMVFCQDTKYVLLDEPLNSLDLRYRVSMMAQLRAAADELNKSVIMVLHDINFAAAYSDRIIAMKAGRVIHEGPTEAIIRSEVLSEIYDLDVNVHQLQGRPVVVY